MVVYWNEIIFPDPYGVYIFGIFQQTSDSGSLKDTVSRDVTMKPASVRKISLKKQIKYTIFRSRKIDSFPKN